MFFFVLLFLVKLFRCAIVSTFAIKLKIRESESSTNRLSSDLQRRGMFRGISFSFLRQRNESDMVYKVHHDSQGARYR